MERQLTSVSDVAAIMMLNTSITNTGVETSQEIDVDIGHLSDMKPVIIIAIIINSSNVG